MTDHDVTDERDIYFCECGELIDLPDRESEPDAWRAYRMKHDHPYPGEPAPAQCPPWCQSREVLGDLEQRHGYEQDSRYPDAWSRYHVSGGPDVYLEQLELRRGDDVEFAPPHLYLDSEHRELTHESARELAAALLDGLRRLEQIAGGG